MRESEVAEPVLTAELSELRDMLEGLEQGTIQEFSDLDRITEAFHHAVAEGATVDQVIAVWQESGLALSDLFGEEALFEAACGLVLDRDGADVLVLSVLLLPLFGYGSGPLELRPEQTAELESLVKERYCYELSEELDVHVLPHLNQLAPGRYRHGLHGCNVLHWLEKQYNGTGQVDDPSAYQVLHEEARDAYITIAIKQCANRIEDAGGESEDELEGEYDLADIAILNGLHVESLAQSVHEVLGLPGRVTVGKPCFIPGLFEQTESHYVNSAVYSAASRYRTLVDGVPGMRLEIRMEVQGKDVRYRLVLLHQGVVVDEAVLNLDGLPFTVGSDQVVDALAEQLEELNFDQGLQLIAVLEDMIYDVFGDEIIQRVVREGSHAGPCH